MDNSLLALLDEHTPLSPIQRQYFSPVAQGHYHYQLNQQEVGIQEPWQILENDQVSIIRSVRYVKDQAIALAVVNHTTSVAQTIDIHFKPCDGADVLAQYSVTGDGHWHVSQRHCGDLFKYSGHVRNGAVYPLLRVFTGNMLQHCQSKDDQPCPVLLPDIRVQASGNNKLKPHIDWRYSRCVEETEKGRKFTCSSQHYDEGNAHFYVNQDNILDFYQWQQDEAQLWQVQLRS
ncbi:hypothetical protein [Thalassotalea maritima]|uniref:hypothetical protein n=1 Tax=Thalassotalea maritima TaxID=3242416 RepID=UPI003528A4EA